MTVRESDTSGLASGCYQELRTQLDRLGNCVATTRSDPEEILFALRKLQRAMIVRFARELAWHQSRVGQCPWLEPDVRKLESRHDRLMAEVASIQASSDRHPLHVCTRVADLAERLMEHETAERRLYDALASAETVNAL
ncbi:MAG: hypothetical protein FJ297_10020 [Planctomycetes bacterium]|nr:hypothetical protein [Planctomycetota bacterium]